ncbi:alpha/beta fold hydrolase [Streptomyces sp. NPDC097619]|uniref:esterase/lipase family protein n=1 Tax=Streptomyces sp. NPDC097619 TaxID=3157228 RepID=UPI0033185426
MGLSLKASVPFTLPALPVGAVRASVLELAILAGHLLVYPTGLLPERSAREGAGGTEEPGATRTVRPPVILLHGFTDNRSVFVLLRRALGGPALRRVESCGYSPLTTDLRTAAARLARQVEEVCERTGHARVDLVGHSLGGLVARYYVQRMGGDARVRTVVTLGTPHQGTRIAPLMDAHPLVRQMRPDSPVIEELRLPAPGCTTRFVSFWSEFDQLMVPPDTARLTHPDLITEDVPVTGIGHLALPVHPAVTAAVRRVLDGPGLRDAAAAGSSTAA